MTKELQDRIIGLVRRAHARSTAANLALLELGGCLVAGPTWGRDEAVFSKLEGIAADFRLVAGLIDGAAEKMRDEEREGRAA